MLKKFFSRSKSHTLLPPKEGKPKTAAPRLERIRSRSMGTVTDTGNLESMLPRRQTAELPAMTDTLWDRIFSFLDEPSLLSLAQCSHRFHTLSKTALTRMGCPDPVKSRRAIEHICAMLSKFKFARNIYRDTDEADFGAGHPFWSTSTSRLRFLLCGAFEKDSGYSGVAELRLLHGRQHYYAILLDPVGQVLYCYNYFGRRCLQMILAHFHKISKGDFVVAYKDLSPPGWQKHVAGLTERIKEHKEARRGRGSSRQDRDEDHEDETLSIDQDASVEFGYLRRQVGPVPRIAI